jgi:hypothetical protein
MAFWPGDPVAARCNCDVFATCTGRLAAAFFFLMFVLVVRLLFWL